MSTLEQTPDHYWLYAGRAALTRGAWEEAHACIVTALRLEESAEALEELGLAAWGLNDATVVFDARERAYILYRRRGDACAAARLATTLALDYFYFRGEHAVASGWLQRARRLLAGEGTCVEQGWLAVTESLIAAWIEHDFAKVERLCAEAAMLGKALSDLDLEMLALACEGLALVSQGEIAEGMRRLDEATLAALSGEMTVADAACMTCCCLIFACEWTRDLGRVTQWLKKLRVLAGHYAHPTQLYFCRTHYAGVLIWQGAWAEAETELEAAITGLEASQPALAAEALLRLAELRCRQGRFEAAVTLLERAESPPFQALRGDFCLLVRAALALAHNDAETAVNLGERFLRAIPHQNRMERIGGLELLIVALAARGDQARAEAVLAELRAVAAAVATKALHAAVRFAEGVVAAAVADFDMARCCFEDAADRYAQSGAPFETAWARLELAGSLLALDQAQAAQQQARSAHTVLHRLGAAPLAAHAEVLLEDIRTTPHGGKTFVDGLTPRELEVLRLIAAGHSNQDIAKTLALSVRTVERHISNIYTKVGVSGAVARAAVTDYAHRHGLLSPATG
jgi:LuxR family maltose regulon positive regulatory protein